MCWWLAGHRALCPPEDVHQPTFSLHNREADYPRDRLHNLGRSADIRIHDEVGELGWGFARQDVLRRAAGAAERFRLGEH